VARPFFDYKMAKNWINLSLCARLYDTRSLDLGPFRVVFKSMALPERTFPFYAADISRKKRGTLLAFKSSLPRKTLGKKAPCRESPLVGGL
jgi:hypothetical protein